MDSTPFGEVPVLENLALHAEAGFSQGSDRLVYNDATMLLAARGPRDDFYKSFLAGVRCTLPGWDTLIVAEYFHIDDGYSPAELDSILSHWLITQVTYEPGLMCRNNLMVSITPPQLTQRSNPFTDALAVSAAMLLDLDDSSGAGPSLFYAIRRPSTSAKITPFAGRAPVRAPVQFGMRLRMEERWIRTQLTSTAQWVEVRSNPLIGREPQDRCSA
ncbi:MAG TPA: hypothetical protein VMU36_08065 [Spirochaetia bacterium]|nr:hypothetical protein [Spirochaetia bacterium]